MKTRALSVLAVVGLAAVANAQPVEGLTYSIVWDLASISAGDNTGSVWAEITPAIGTATAWNTSPGKGQAATLKAFASSIIDLLNDSNGTNGTLTWSVPAAFNIAAKPGESDGNGGIKGSNSGQFGPPANPTPNVDGKVKILDLKWSLGTAGTYTVNYSTKAASAKVYLDAGLPAWVGENATKTDGKGGFEVTPAPSAAALLGLGGLLVARRRR